MLARVVTGATRCYDARHAATEFQLPMARGVQARGGTYLQFLKFCIPLRAYLFDPQYSARQFLQNQPRVIFDTLSQHQAGTTASAEQLWP